MRSSQVVPGQGGLAQQYVNLRHDARGGGNLLVHQQLGAIALPTNPTNGETLTLTINGTAIVITFVTGSVGTTAGNVLIQSTAALTAAALAAFLNQPQTTTANAVALSTADQQLVSYLSWPLSGTTITPCSSNTSLYGPLSSFSASTTVTGASWTAQTHAALRRARRRLCQRHARHLLGRLYAHGDRTKQPSADRCSLDRYFGHPRVDDRHRGVFP